MQCDVLIRGGQVFDGEGNPPVRSDVAVANGMVIAIGPDLAHEAAKVIDASGCWVTPGFIDLHTHYDLELEVAPGLEESVRHGVTTVVIGGCSLSTALASREELLNLFCRVESLPRAVVSGWLDARPAFDGVAGYYAHLERAPIGPNVASFLGHSELRIAAMGYVRAMTVKRARASELARMESILRSALDEGYLGLSVDLLPWHRIEAGAFQGEPVPSRRAAWSEVTRLCGTLRKRDRILQATPDAMSRMSVLFLFWLSLGAFGFAGLRKALRVTVVSAMDIVSNRMIWRMQLLGARMAGMLGGNFLWQVLVEPFLNFASGVNTPIFEELPAGVRAISADEDGRRALFRDSKFRAAFRRDWTTPSELMFHRDFAKIEIVACPHDDGAPDLAGRTLADLAEKSDDSDGLDVFMDLLAAHGSALRWRTVLGNDRDAERHAIIRSPYTIPGFNDSGAHNQQMAFHCGALSLLSQVLGTPSLMPVEEAVYRLCGRTAAWLGVDAGTLAVGRVADVSIIDPEILKGGVGGPVEVHDPRFGNAPRMVRRTCGSVRAVLIGGAVAFEDGAFASDLGDRRYGRLLRATRSSRRRSAQSAPSAQSAQSSTA